MIKKKLSILTTLLLMAATGAVAQSPYSVTLKEGTEDANHWTIEPISAGAGVPVSATYNGSKHVKSVKYVKKLRTPEVTAPTAKSLTYSGSAQELVNAGSTTGGTMQYKVGSGSYSAEIPTATNAGTYTVYYKVVGGEAYSDVDEASISVTIAQAQATAKSSKSSWNVGDIICSDGNAYTISANTTIPSGKTPTAIVAYKGSATGDDDYKNGLAFALTDVINPSSTYPTYQWRAYVNNKTVALANPSQVGVNDDISGKVESGRTLNNLTCTGYPYKRNSATAAARQDWPAFYQAGFFYTVARPDVVSEWFLPSIYQWNQMVKGLLGVTTNLTTSANSNLAWEKINEKLQTAINDVNVKAAGLVDGPYWTSSEMSATQARCYRAGGTGGYGDKTENMRVRPIIAF